MNYIEVTDKKTRNEFHRVPKILYKDDNNWTCPLDMEIENIFNPAKNECFTNGNAVRWVLKDDFGNLIGRIAAFFDRNKANLNPQPTGGIGFFECIHDQQAANLLFQTAREWLESNGMEAMDGPINFGENFVYWGLLVEGFTQQGYGMPYNFPYYRELFENYGFQIYFEQYSFHDVFSKPYPERMKKFAEHFLEKPEYSFRHLEMTNVDKYLNQLVEMYNKVWADFLENYNPLKYDDFYNIFKEAKALLNEKTIWFAYHNEMPIGFLIAFPDINQIFRKLKNGKLHLINILKLMYYRRRAVTRARLLLSGIIPDYQRTGVITALYLKLTDSMRSLGMTELELSWVGDYNLTVNRMYSQFGATKEKTHITYRYLFNKDAEFIRFTNQSQKFSKNKKNE
ncbi:MAG: GNAT family N-acetyltransferase [Bacteroidales bacterium]|nr:GNAT family N-acetyltransferase [Bacteroidales bacterium]